MTWVSLSERFLPAADEDISSSSMNRRETRGKQRRTDSELYDRDQGQARQGKVRHRKY